MMKMTVAANPVGSALVSITEDLICVPEEEHQERYEQEGTAVETSEVLYLVSPESAENPCRDLRGVLHTLSLACKYIYPQHKITTYTLRPRKPSLNSRHDEDYYERLADEEGRPQRGATIVSAPRQLPTSDSLYI